MTQPTHDDERRDVRKAAASLIEAALDEFHHQEGARQRSYDFAVDVLHDLAAAGWVDPEEARVITEQRDRAWRKQAGAEKDRDWLQAQRDALLPVVEAARALRDAAANQFEVVSEVPPSALQRAVGGVCYAVDALDQKAPETALSATQSAEPCSCGPSCVCHPEPLVDVSDVPLKVLADAAGDTALGRSVARVAGQVAKGEAPITA